MRSFNVLVKNALGSSEELKLLKNNNLLFESLSQASKACLLGAIQDIIDKPLLIIAGAGQEEFLLYSDLEVFAQTAIIEFPSKESFGIEEPSSEMIGKRLQALEQIIQAKNPIILTSLQAILEKVPQKKDLEKKQLTLEVGKDTPFEALIHSFTSIGYKKTSLTTEKGMFCVRGGLIDIFPVTGIDPVRIEFFGDTIESMRFFDPLSQKSIKSTQEITIPMAKDPTHEHEGTSLFELLGSCCVVFDDIETQEDRYASFASLKRSSKEILSTENLFSIIEQNQIIFFSGRPIEQLAQVLSKESSKKFYSETEFSHLLSFDFFNRTLQALKIRHPFQNLTEYLKETVQQDTTLLGLVKKYQEEHLPKIFFFSQTESEELLLKEKLTSYAISYSQDDLYRGYLSMGFSLKNSNTLIIPLTEIIKRVKVRREQGATYHQTTVYTGFDALIGDSVVHFNHGIGTFLGTELKKNIEGYEEEYFALQYANDAKLFIPFTQAHLLSKYIGSHETKPTLHAIGSSKWQKQKETTERAIVTYAKSLLELYAKRMYHEGYAFPEDSPAIRAFDGEFPFVETEDQLQAIREVRKDMCSSKAMDRLICGDVGYGKTEVAMRAAFKAVIDGKKQVALLVPTTVLAMQHYDTFVERMQNFGVNVGILSRFSPIKELKNTIAGIQSGAIDIAIGTHKIVQKDIVFKDLGLIIIDEEQRFGVGVKEHLKQLKNEVDCLTLSATPIPRTLYMSLVGARDLSVINTPPQDRLPITTIVADTSDRIIQEALLRELNRDGQAFFIHNRVETIYTAQERIERLLPKARILVAHGKMHADELDIVFHNFREGKADILVATSIIESGIDVPNANTIIVENAHQFGMADLYQIRGRVGRWNRRAYAYFLIPQRRIISETARNRVMAIAQTSGHGGGFQIAMRDLELRGAGDILGVEQSGNVTSIGFHLYCKLLKRTVDTLQGKSTPIILDTKIETPFQARLPFDYVNDEALRIEFYQRFGDATSLEEVDAIWEEIQDRFGTPPIEAEWLYQQMRIRTVAAQKNYIKVKIHNFVLILEKKQGAQTISKRVLLGPIKTPKQLGEKVLKILIK